jgi:hypothetical protein
MISLEAFFHAEEFRKHLANHLERFAAFAFPGDADTSSGEGSSPEGSVIDPPKLMLAWTNPISLRPPNYTRYTK